MADRFFTAKITVNFRRMNADNVKKLEQVIKDVLFDHLWYDTIEIQVLEHK